jgi:hypothetical protein
VLAEDEQARGRPHEATGHEPRRRWRVSPRRWFRVVWRAAPHTV